MTTREHDIALLDGPTRHDRERWRMMLAAEQQGVDLGEMGLDDDGTPLEADLARSGFFGDLGSDLVLDGEAGEHIARRSLGDFLIRLREVAVERRWGVDEATLLNFAFRYGHHYVEVDPARRQVLPLPAPRDAVRRKIQKFEPWFRGQHGKMSAAIPQYHLRPKTRQQEDRDAAKFAEELAEWRVPQTYSLDNRAEIAMWMLLAGTAVVHVGVTYEDADDYLIDLETGQPLPRPVMETEVFGPQQVWCDDKVPTISRMRWFGVDRFVPVAEARALYPENRQDIVGEIPVGAERGLTVARRVQRLTAREDPFHEELRGEVSSGPGVAVDEEEETVLCEFYGKPGLVLEVPFLDLLPPDSVPMEVIHPGGAEPALVRFPEGLYVVFTASGTVLDISPNIYGKLPFRDFRFSKSSGFYGYAPATPLREIQQAINWVYSMSEQHLLKVGNAQLLIPREARMKRRGLMTTAWQRIFYRANRFGAKPEYMRPPPWPVDATRLLEQLDRAWMDISGMHEVTEGRIPSSDISGVAISLLQEQDAHQLGFASEDLEDGFVDIVKMELEFIQRFFPANDPRLVQLAGDAAYSLRAFMEANLADGLDVQVVRGSALPRSPAAVKAEAKELFMMGALTDDFGRPDVRRLQNLFGLGSEDELYAEQEADVQNARNEEELILSLSVEQAALILALFMQTGQLPGPIMPQPEDDPVVHERQHRLTLKRLRTDQRVHPMNAEVLRLHWKFTVLMAAEVLAVAQPGAVAAVVGPGALGGGQQQGEETEPAGESAD